MYQWGPFLKRDHLDFFDKAAGYLPRVDDPHPLQGKVLQSRLDGTGQQICMEISSSMFDISMQNFRTPRRASAADG
jgi:hypothetical protein